MNLKGKVLISGISSAVITTGGIFIYNMATKPSSKSKEVSEDSQKDVSTAKDSVVQSQINSVEKEQDNLTAGEDQISIKEGNEYIDADLESFISTKCKSEECQNVFNLLKEKGRCIVKIDDGSSYYEQWYESDDIEGLHSHLTSNWSSYENNCKQRDYLIFEKENGNWKFKGTEEQFIWT